MSTEKGTNSSRTAAPETGERPGASEEMPSERVAGADEAAAAQSEAPPAENQESPGDGTVPEDADQLVAALLEARHQAETHWDTVLRTKAELENLRKRAQRDVENAHKYALERFLEELLPIRDSMELGVVAAREENVQVEQVREGVELTLKMLTAALEKFGVEVIDPVGKAFNPEFHQAMSVQEVPGVDSGVVTSVMQKGFVLNGRLVRPALVMVAK